CTPRSSRSRTTGGSTPRSRWACCSCSWWTSACSTARRTRCRSAKPRPGASCGWRSRSSSTSRSTSSCCTSCRATRGSWASTALEFLAGWVVEYSLSVDNIFVFVVVLSYFGIATKYQHRVLFFGILGALVFRAAFIALGALLLRYQWVILVFGAFLVFTGFKM